MPVAALLVFGRGKSIKPGVSLNRVIGAGQIGC